VLNEAGIAAKLFGAKDTEHSRIDENLGVPDDPSTKAMFEFVGEMTKK
jgi:arylformamidase